MANPYTPIPVTVERIITEVDTKDIKTFRLIFDNKEDEQNFNYLPGQFAELSLLGKGESPVGIASSPTQPGYLEFTVQKAGVVTSALHDMEAGSRMGIRGPLGNHWPIDYLEGKQVVIVGGGFAFTTQRSLINYMLHEKNRPRFGKIIVVYGARMPGLLLYKDELVAWQKRDDIELNITVDRGDADWQGKVGFVPSVCKEISPCAETPWR
jgi:sulfhydrogenase subunit gamma (sulfur reductase)